MSRTTWLRSFLATDRSLAPVALRAALAVAMFPHGAQKAFGWFGGYGFEGTMAWFAEQVGVPAPLAAGSILLEVLGPLLLILGWERAPLRSDSRA